jgi:hypothetical protein
MSMMSQFGLQGNIFLFQLSYALAQCGKLIRRACMVITGSMCHGFLLVG